MNDFTERCDENNRVLVTLRAGAIILEKAMKYLQSDRVTIKRSAA